MTDRFEGRIALLTGAASGMGRATSLHLAREGATVVGLDVNGEGLEETASLVAEAGGRFAGRLVDVRHRQECHDAVAATVAEHGRLDILGNIAGVARSHHFTDVTEAEYDLIMGVNIDGMFWLCQAAIPAIIESSGTIINIASNAGLMGQAYTVAYCASKGAVVNFTRALAMEYVKQNVRINAIAPGGVNTPMTTGFDLPEGIDYKLMTPYVGYRDMADPEHIANIFAFLASDEAANVHGAIWSADNGLVAG
ncbi:MAG: SDR family oxidoreductase [Acidimicrobiia bacterium]|nr:SDR family oxidoreductase [Acidimicrobiia bacterium]MDH5238812.1 SDR family oxidoreductase [Acidimicrobiia bacterium]